MNKTLHENLTQKNERKHIWTFITNSKLKFKWSEDYHTYNQFAHKLGIIKC